MNQPESSLPAYNGAAQRVSGSASEADALLCLLDLQPGMRVLDVGCCKAEYAIRLLDIYPSVEATGIDTNAAHLAYARERAKAAGAANRLTLIESSLLSAQPILDLFDAVICIGAAQIFGTWRDALRDLSALVGTGGLVLIADGYWKHESALSAATGFCPDHAGNVVVGEEAGLLPLYAIIDDGEVWEDHERHYTGALERYTASHPDDTDVRATRDHMHALCRMYLRLSRDMLGYGWYLFRKS